MTASSCSPMRAGEHLGRSEEVDRETMMTGSAYLEHRIFQIAGLKVIPKGERRKWEENVRGTSPGRLGGLKVMASRHIYNPTILRGPGMFPVPLSSWDIAAPLFNTTRFTGTSETTRQSGVDGAFRHDELDSELSKITFEFKWNLRKKNWIKHFTEDFIWFSYYKWGGRCYTVEYF